MQISLGTTYTNMGSGAETLDLGIDPQIGRYIMQNKIYTDKAIGAQEYPSNGRDAIRKLRALPALLREDLNVLRSVRSGKTIEEAVEKNVRIGVDSSRGSIPLAETDILAPYIELLKGKTMAELDEFIAKTEALLERVERVAKTQLPIIRMDLSDPETVRFVDYGTGMTREVMDKIFRMYGRSDKRDRTGRNLTGGFGIGAKSAFAAETDVFFVTTRSVIDDKTYHMMVTNEKVTIGEAARPLDHYGTLVEVPMTSKKMRDAYEAKYRQKVALWEEACHLVLPNGDAQLVSRQQAPWDAATSIVKTKGKGWRAVVLPESGADANLDTIVVDRIPFPIEQRSYPGFRLVVELEVAELVTLPATRESVEKNDQRDELMEKVNRAIRADARKQIAAIVQETDNVALGNDVATAVSRLRGKMVQLWYVERGGTTGIQNVNLPQPANDTAARLGSRDPIHRLKTRCFGTVSEIQTSWSSLVYGRARLTDEQMGAIAYLGGGGHLGKMCQKRTRRVAWSPRVTLTSAAPPEYDAEGEPQTRHESHNVPGWVQFWDHPVDVYRADVAVDEDGVRLEWVKVARNEPWLQRVMQPHDETYAIFTTKELHTNRATAIAQLLGHAPPKPVKLDDKLARSLSPGAKKVYVILADTGPMHELNRAWGILSLMDLPRDPQERVVRSRFEKGVPRVTVITRTGKGTQYEIDWVARQAAYGSVVVNVKPDEEDELIILPYWAENGVELRVPAKPGKTSWTSYECVLAMRNLSEERIAYLREHDVTILSLADLKRRIEAATVNVLIRKQGKFERAEKVRVADLLEGKHEIVSIGDYHNIGNLVTCGKDLDEQVVPRHLPEGMMVVCNEVMTWVQRLAAMRGMTKKCPQPLRMRDYVLSLFDEKPQRTLVRMSLKDWIQHAKSLAIEDDEATMLEAWVHDAPRAIMETTLLNAEIVRVMPMPKGKKTDDE